MKTRTTVILIIIAIILTSFSLYIFRYTSNKWYYFSETIGTTVFTQLEISNATKIIITQPSGKIITLEKEDEIWYVESSDKIPADKTKIIKFLDALANIKVVQNIYTDKMGAENLSLMPPTKKDQTNSGSEIQIFINQNPLSSLIVGKYRDDNNSINKSETVIGRYMRFKDNSDVFFTDQLLTELSYSSEDWINSKKQNKK